MKQLGVLIIFLLSNINYSSAQVNIKVGYNGLYMKQPTFNNILENYNMAQTNLTQQFGKTNFLHGIEIGARYKIKKNIAFELTWMNHQSTNNKANGIDLNAIAFDKSWKVSSTEYSFGLENYIGSFGFGATFGRRSFKYLSKVAGLSKKINIFDDSILNSRFYLILHVSSGNSGFALKPYIQIPWAELNLNKVSNQLNNSSGDFLEDYKGFGLNLVFYNGPQ